MPKRIDIKSILIIGSGPIVIGQASEFDYSGAQACKALKEEGYKVILVNSNPATIMTDPNMADVTYVEPIVCQSLEKIISQERPDAILPTMGGQTALNCALDLSKKGILKKYNVQLIGANEDVICKAEDRGRFRDSMAKIGLYCPKSFICNNMEDAIKAQTKIGYPTLIRPSFTMGGSGGGIAYNKDEFLNICERGFDASHTHELLIEQSVLGWKEYEMEVIRDRQDNCIIVCSIENFDPMGIHTGDSITVAPIQTLSDKEYQIMRDASIAVLREIGVETGGANVQFAINPNSGQMIVIEMNPRVSRSSALASKATGFPIAKVAAKLAVGYTLNELKNDITQGRTPASFEPTIDYVVTKIPRFAFEKFPTTDDKLTTQMKSVGEVMSIGRTFKESIQKALRGLETGLSGFDNRSKDLDKIRSELANPSYERILYIADAFRNGLTVDEVYSLSFIDKWFLYAIEEIILEEKKLNGLSLSDLNFENLYKLKAIGFSDKRLSYLLKSSEQKVRDYRCKLGVKPVYKRIDTCSAEFETNTAYMYSTYEEEDESCPTNKRKIMILGGGPNRIGQGIEFDYCCVQAALALRDENWETIMVNCNPETVSTDYDISDRLYFESLTLEDVLNIVEIEKPYGLIVHYGGQTPLKLANHLVARGVNIIGTSANSIDLAEDRERFQKILCKLNLKQPKNRIVNYKEDILKLANEVKYPLIVRPSYVLGGRSMRIVNNNYELNNYVREAVKVSDKSPILLDHFLNDAIEVDVDCICDGKDVVICAIMQHIEQAGVHSGDSACSIPAFSLSDEILNNIRIQTKKLALEIGVIGLMNVQFAVQNDIIYVLEVNPRASRTVPFVSKAIGIPIAKIATKVMIGHSLKNLNFIKEYIPNYFSVKESVFPFIKFPGVDTILGPEMLSTGEVMGVGKTFLEAYLKSQISAGEEITSNGKVFMSVKDEDKKLLVSIAKLFNNNGYKICATKGTANYLNDRGFAVEIVNKVMEGRPHIVDIIKNNDINIVINTVNNNYQSIKDSHSIRSNALLMKIPLYTTISGAMAIGGSLKDIDNYNVYSLQSLHKYINNK